MSDLMQSFTANFALIAMLVMVWNMMSDWTASLRPFLRSLVIGLVLAAAVALSMQTAMELLPGFPFDLRNALGTLAALFGGLPAAILAAGTASAIRIDMGGGGVHSALAGIWLNASVGLVVRYFWGKRPIDTRAILLCVAGVLLVSPPCYLLIPAEIRADIFARTIVPLLMASSVSIVVVGILLMREENRGRLMRENAIFRNIVQQLPHALSVQSARGEVLVTNPAHGHLFDWSEPSPVHDDPDADDPAQRPLEEEIRLLESGEPYRFDHRMTKGDERRVWISTLKAPLHDAKGDLVGVITCSHDITDEKIAQEAKNDFISNVSHELRTPLTSIRGALGLVNSGAFGEFPAKAARMLTIAQSNCERLVGLINEILDIEKITTGKMRMHFDTHPLRNLLEDVITASASYLAEKEVTIALEDDAHNATVNVDKARLDQVLGNLISNATKFSPAGATITITAERIEGDVVISLIDQGPGVPKEFQDRIFGRFEQHDTSDMRAKGGTGLGLFISKEITTRLGGTIGFERDRADGARFFVRLPEIGFGPVALPDGEDDRRARILVCSDNPDMAVQMRQMLDAEGFASDLALDLRSMGDLAEHRTYLAALIDADVLSTAANVLTEVSLPVIVVAGSDLAAAPLGGVTLGVMEFMRKPVDAGHLGEALRRATERDPGARLDVLHVEDDADTLTLVAHAIGPSAAVSRARSMAEARRAIQAQLFDLVILDIDMPDGSGLDLLSELPKLTKVIVFAGVEPDAALGDSVRAVLTKSRATETDVAAMVRSLQGPPADGRTGSQATLRHAS